ncbi:MAG: hypothetical protein KBC64_02430 [Simkaniaceae bacterium]|nr:hypothetical protein [Simkaniaceae bacterium]
MLILGTALMTLLSSLDPHSISEHLAFYHLYKETSEGKLALERASLLLNPEGVAISPFDLPKLDVSPLIHLAAATPFGQTPKLTESQLSLIETLSLSLANRKLKGHHVWTLEEIDQLSPHEIDLSRSLFLHELSREEIRQYEAALDLMALEVRAHLPTNPTPLDKVEAINKLIFYDRQFRFPPHSEHIKDIDLYTLLPSVIDSHRGVCLGVSILYICLAQRLDLSLDIYTPPGHIFVSAEGRHIETTARGIAMPTEAYLGIQTKYLPPRSIKEVIGYSFFNQASVAWQKKDYPRAIDLYLKALRYAPDDPLIKMLLGYNYLFVGDTKKGKALLKEIQGVPFEGGILIERGPEDYLKGHIDAKGLEAIWQHTDEYRSSIEEKKEVLEKIAIKFPKFRDGLFHLAICYLQLGRGREGKETLLKYHAIDPNNPLVEYYLAILSMQRYEYQDASKYLASALKLTAAQDHHPQALKQLKQTLLRTYKL